MTSPSTPLEESKTGRAFLQRRVAVAGVIGGAIGGLFLVSRSVGALLSGETHEFAHPSFWFHFGGALSMLMMWLICRTGQRSVRVVRGVEAVGLLGASVGYSLMALAIPAWQMPHFIVLLALQGGLVARAIYVPSTARRTLVLTLAAGVPALLATYLMYRDVDVSDWHHIEESTRQMTGPEIAASQTSFAALWWLVTIVLCTGASRVIYGLRKSARDARRLGQYELTEKLGEGGMGVVFRAQHAMLHRPTAVKLLPLAKTGESSLARFEKEVRQTARLTHPNTVTIFDYGRTPDGVFYYAMELLDGATLRSVVDVDGAQPAARVARMLQQAAGALAEAHEAGLVHRDIKPANIMFARQGGELDVTKVLDFGLVKDIERGDQVGLTQADSVTGTPQYMAPEAITSPAMVDGRSDLYGLGAVAYYLLTGDHVFTGSTVVEVCSHHLHSAPVPVEARAAGVSSELAAIIMGCLAKDPAERPQSAKELAAAVQACDVPRWTQADAEGWWRRCEATLSDETLGDASTASGLTMEIDFARRTRR